MAKLIPFDPGDRHALDRIQMLKFWESMRGWFKKALNLRMQSLPSHTIPIQICLEKKIFDAGEDPFPYAYMGGDPTHLQITDRQVYSTHEELICSKAANPTFSNETHSTLSFQFSILCHAVITGLQSCQGFEEMKPPSQSFLKCTVVFYVLQQLPKCPYEAR
ncbi:hypothetical protein CVT25_012480 [Psilocybe cyanescens]|uniref:Uncharacterized protein n=1 Tax=Psilocybe cyanescens TaxID=93625 RepID=A0A409XHE3_PSICY|nr:hypothetical protein CVT25_012480 [Psilocybe cyanescens]